MTVRKRIAKAAADFKFMETPCPTCGTEHALINGFWLAAQRQKAGVTQRQMAMRLFIAPSYLCDIERNRRNCPPVIRAAYETLVDAFNEGR